MKINQIFILILCLLFSPLAWASTSNKAFKVEYLKIAINKETCSNFTLTAENIIEQITCTLSNDQHQKALDFLSNSKKYHRMYDSRAVFTSSTQSIYYTPIQTLELQSMVEIYTTDPVVKFSWNFSDFTYYLNYQVVFELYESNNLSLLLRKQIPLKE